MGVVKKYRSRALSEDEEEKEKILKSPKATEGIKNGKKKKKKAKVQGLSFQNDDEEESEPIFKIKKSKNSRMVSKGIELSTSSETISEIEASSSGRYNVEALAALKASQSSLPQFTTEEEKKEQEEKPVEEVLEGEEAISRTTPFRNDLSEGAINDKIDINNNGNGHVNNDLSIAEQLAIKKAKHQRIIAAKGVLKGRISTADLIDDGNVFNHDYNNLSSDIMKSNPSSSLNDDDDSFIPLNPQSDHHHHHHINSLHENNFNLTSQVHGEMNEMDTKVEVELWEQEALKRGNNLSSKSLKIDALSDLENNFSDLIRPSNSSFSSHDNGGQSVKPILEETLLGVKKVIFQAKQAQESNVRKLESLKLELETNQLKLKSLQSGGKEKVEKKVLAMIKLRTWCATLVGCVRSKAIEVKECHDFIQSSVQEALRIRQTRRQEFFNDSLIHILLSGSNYLEKKNKLNSTQSVGSGTEHYGFVSLQGYRLPVEYESELSETRNHGDDDVDEMGRDRTFIWKRAREERLRDRERRRVHAYRKRFGMLKSSTCSSSSNDMNTRKKRMTKTVIKKAKRKKVKKKIKDDDDDDDGWGGMAGFAGRGGLGLGCSSSVESESEEEVEVEEEVDVSDNDDDDNNDDDEILVNSKYEIISDADDSETEMIDRLNKRKNLIKASRVIFDDVSEEFSSLARIKTEIENWRKDHSHEFKASYVMQSLPKILSPFGETELCEWPVLWLGFGEQDLQSSLLSESNHDMLVENVDVQVKKQMEEALFYHAGEQGALFPITDQSWVGELADFAEGSMEDINDMDDGADQLVPKMVVETVIPKLVILILNGYDVYSFYMTKCLVSCCGELLEFGLDIDKDLSVLLSSPIQIMQQAVSDLIIPIAACLLNKNEIDDDEDSEEIESIQDGAYHIMLTQLLFSLKLLRNASAWGALVNPTLLSKIIVKDLLVDKIIPALVQVIQFKRHSDVCRLAENLISALPPDPKKIGWGMELMKEKGSMISLLKSLEDSVEEDVLVALRNKFEIDVI